MNSSLRNTFIAIFTLLAIGCGWYVLQRRENVPTDTGATLQSPPSSTSSSTQDDPLSAAQVANSAGLGEAAREAASATASEAFQGVYSNAQYGFSFHYPSTLTIGETTSPDDGATTILVQDVAQHIGFQIYITPFTDSDSVITADRVQQSLPDLVIQDAHPITLGGSSAGLSFLTHDASFGESRQVWVVHAGNLYQVSTYRSQDVLLEKVLASWVFAK